MIEKLKDRTYMVIGFVMNGKFFDENYKTFVLIVEAMLEREGYTCQPCEVANESTDETK